MADPPLLFLDVDGVLIPFRARQTAASAGGTSGNPLLDRLDPRDGRALMALECRLAWATTWMADANEEVAPRLGLPQLPVVDFPDDEPAGSSGLHWKTEALVRWAAGRPFVWLDDEITVADRKWVEAHHPAGALLHRVDPMTGLTEPDFATVREWLSGDLALSPS